jgi:hypothetical protein
MKHLVFTTIDSVRRVVIFSLLVSACCLGVRAATANEAIEARFFDEQARRAFSERDYVRALELFLLSAPTDASAGVLYNIAICAQLANNPQLAFVYFEKHRQSNDQDPERNRIAAQHVAKLQQKLALVRIESDPPGAKILIDRKELGYFGETPRTVPLDPGHHTIELELAGYKNAAAVTRVEANTLKELRVTLEQRTATILIATDPADATLSLYAQGKRVRGIDPGTKTAVPVMEYLVKAERRGYLPADARIAVTEGTLNQLQLTLKRRLQQRARLLVDAHQVDARVYLDGRLAGATPATLPSVPVGKHRVVVKAAGYAPWTRTIDLKANETRYLSVVLERASSEDAGSGRNTQ